MNPFTPPGAFSTIPFAADPFCRSPFASVPTFQAGLPGAGLNAPVFSQFPAFAGGCGLNPIAGLTNYSVPQGLTTPWSTLGAACCI